MRTALQNHTAWRRRGKPPVNTPEQLIRVFEERYGDRALPFLVKVAALPSTFTADVPRLLAAVRILIHRDLGRAMVARSLTGETV